MKKIGFEENGIILGYRAIRKVSWRKKEGGKPMRNT